MLLTAKELLAVLLVSTPIFFFARPFATLFMSEQDFARRRNIWYALTCAVFLSPSFWIFVLLAALVLIFAVKGDSNPTALYLLLLHAIPPATQRVPMFGISYLFDLDTGLLLSVCILMPTAFRLMRSAPVLRYRGLRVLDIALLAYGVLTSILYVRLQDSTGALFDITFTDCLRRAFVFFFSLFIPYYAISRSIGNKAALVESMAAFCISCALMSGIAIFESAKHWLLYAEIARFWGAPEVTTYVMRGDSLRAMASSGHPLALGYLVAIAFGFWLYLKSHVRSRSRQIGVSIFLWLGLIASYSRGPWIGAVAIFFLFASLCPNGTRKLLRATAISVGVLIVISLTPLGDRIVRVMPFMGGTVDSANVIYRQRLFDRSWEIIEQSPIFGDQGALLKMQDLRQGEGIIDMINTYLQILLDNGFVGLSLFLTFILVAALGAFRKSRGLSTVDRDSAEIGASLVACTIGTLLMIESGGCDRVMISVLVGLMAGYVYAVSSSSVHPSSVPGNSSKQMAQRST